MANMEPSKHLPDFKKEIIEAEHGDKQSVKFLRNLLANCAETMPTWILLEVSRKMADCIEADNAGLGG